MICFPVRPSLHFNYYEIVDSEMLDSKVVSEEGTRKIYLAMIPHEPKQTIRQHFRNDIVSTLIIRGPVLVPRLNLDWYQPLENALLDLETGKMCPFSNKLYSTYLVHRNLLDGKVALEDMPHFYHFPEFHEQGIMIVVGHQRIGKGTAMPILRSLCSEGWRVTSASRNLRVRTGGGEEA